MEEKPRHPQGLAVLFFTEMWERFGFYTMASMLALYLSRSIGMSDTRAGEITGIFMGFVWLSPIFGGFLADRKLGFVKSILIGALVLCLGYALLAIPDIRFVYFALFVVVIGNGLFKPNISTLVGNLYPPGSPLKDSAFNIFYMGINIGSLFAPIAGAYLTSRFGWHWGFFAASLGMLFSFAIFSLFLKHVKHADIFGESKKEAGSADDIKMTGTGKTCITVAIMAIIALFIAPIAIDSAIWKILGYGGSAFLLVILVSCIYRKYVRPEEKERVLALLVVFCIVIIFWLGFNQSFVTFPFWVEKYTDLSRIPGWMPSMSILQSAFNPFFIIILTPFVVFFWSYLGRRGKEPSSAGKIGWGMILTAVAFAVMAAASMKYSYEKIAFEKAGQTFYGASMWWIVLAYFFISLGELFLSPMGLSYCNKVAPSRMRGLVMGGWFGATGVGAAYSGVLSSYLQVWFRSQTVLFFVLAGASLLGVVLLLFFMKRLKQ